MKKVFLLVTLALGIGITQSTPAQSKKDLNGIKTISFYGVDFSHAKMRGAEEDVEKLLTAFSRINDLFESESRKYNINKTFGVKNSELFNAQVKNTINEISGKNLFTDDNQYCVTDNEINHLVGSLKKRGDSPYGAIIVAGLLNKTANQGTFTYVVFEQNTNKVIFQKELSGKAKGFGLRNFWAGALHDTMKSLK